MSSEANQRTIEAIAAARDNIALIREWGGALDLDALRNDRKSRYAIERAFMALDAAVRDVPAELLATHGIPANLITGFRNVLAHTYDDILDDRVILTIREDLPALDLALAGMLAAVRQGH
jgi:uncharacterized protein with HEPN domain